MRTLGPNTNAPKELLSRKCILVVGEDRRDVVALLGSPEDASHAFRSYEFWKQADFTLVLSGIGTGCVEPLMWELLGTKVIEEIMLIGTAGKMPGASIPIGQACAISEAFLAGTGLDQEGIVEPLKPRWELPADIPTASSVSTDFFYGFSPRVMAGEYPFDQGHLRERYQEHIRRGTQLVEMEVAQFYAFCDRFGGPTLRYLAIKGASNDLGNDARQVAESKGVIARCMELAKQL